MDQQTAKAAAKETKKENEPQTEALKVARHGNVALHLMGLRGRLKNLFELTGVLSLFEGRSHTGAPLNSEEV